MFGTTIEDLEVGDKVTTEIPNFRVTAINDDSIEAVETGDSDKQITVDAKVFKYRWDKVGDSFSPNNPPEPLIPHKTDESVYRCDDCGDEVPLASVDSHPCVEPA